MQTAKEMAKDLVQVQGNMFIRELLREHNYPPKRTQSELLDTLNEAIDDGKITAKILREWLERVEGWGRQSVYLWKVPKNLRREPWWNPDDLEARVRSVKIGKWDADPTRVFADKFTLTAVRFRDDVLTFQWHKAWENLLRDNTFDYSKEDLDSDDTIVFHAFRQSKRRATVRVQIRPRSGIAAAFVQIPYSSDEHTIVKEVAIETAQKVVPKSKFRTFDMSAVINRLDAGQLGETDDSLWTKSARLQLDGAYIELASTTAGKGYRSFTELREARETLLGRNLEGRKAAFYFSAPGGIDVNRPVRVDFYNDDQRFWLRAGMNEEQVWKFIERIAREAA